MALLQSSQEGQSQSSQSQAGVWLELCCGFSFICALAMAGGGRVPEQSAWVHADGYTGEDQTYLHIAFIL